MIYIYLTKQVNRLKLANLQTTTSDLAKLYTMDKFGADSCLMVEKRNHKIHSILRNAHSYVKGRIMEIGKYLHTMVLGWRSWKPLATTPRNGVYKADWNRGVSEWLQPFSLHAPRTSCLGSPVARYHRPFEARSLNSTRRETFQQLAACNSPSYSGWFTPRNIPPGSPAAFAPVTEPLGGVKPRESQYEAIEKGAVYVRVNFKLYLFEFVNNGLSFMYILVFGYKGVFRDFRNCIYFVCSHLGVLLVTVLVATRM